MDLFEYVELLKLPELSAYAVIDILAISFVIYRLFLLLKGTRAAKMATGSAVLVVVYLLARTFHLYTIQWFLTYFVAYAAFAVIVIYQEEIRRILANIGNNPFFRPFSDRDGRPNLDDIVLAAVTLSSKRIGALVVIERNMGLRSYTENGITLDARLSYDLLVTIFQPETSLHDGAVIVRGNTIAAASCFLPLTLEPHLSKEYGTRHRAAIGISEETDAVAVVVSEETGRISVAMDGKLKRFQDAEALTGFLRDLFQPVEDRLGPLVRRWRRRKAKTPAGGGA